MNTFVTAAIFVAVFMPNAMDACKCKFPTIMVGDVSTSLGLTGQFGFHSDLLVFATNLTLKSTGSTMMIYDNVANNIGYTKFLKPAMSCVVDQNIRESIHVSQRWYSRDCVPDVSPSASTVYHNVNYATCIPESITSTQSLFGYQNQAVSYTNFRVPSPAEAQQWEEYITRSLADCANRF